ncbi:uncharacterized protein KGF55_004313 [Candida pseudojiufengensis]|uniref:uncharacterized protein n=1 Tax=Candida pseudojiufengensis TaxID=497109 RepID=UPI0022258B63|nr:uncharacterized protein KGF55_004313 [Candida pseudojiufengensis]KAI5960743.1 hypothetical protein KGF55_004313 [Candida pseudojiufengensis]
MVSRSSSRSSSTSINGSSRKSSVSVSNGNVKIKKSNAKENSKINDNKRRNEEIETPETPDSSNKRKSRRIAQLGNVPTLSASPNIKELSSQVISDSEESQNVEPITLPFIEPDLAIPTPSYTGQPLEEFPSAKIKKESLWPAKLRRKKGKDSETNDKNNRESSLSIDEENDNNIKIEQEYKSNLQTPITHNIVQESELRSPNENIPQSPSKKIKVVVKTPKQTTIINKATPVNALKKIKIISPKKSPVSSKLLAPNTKVENNNTHFNFNDSFEDDTYKDNDDFCFACGRPGVFICCETCPKSFHFTCCDPPLEEPPEDDWFCHECFAKKNPKLLPNWKEVGIFGKLLNDLQIRNPKVFQLPQKIREDTFIGVETGDFGDYADDSEKPDLPKKTTNGSLQIPGFNKNIDLEIENLYNEKGEPYLCHKCGDSGQNHRTLIKCDYCPLIYHVDCLDYPMFGPKTIGDKWRCPNHIKDLLPRGLPELRQFKDTEILEASLKSNFLKIMAMENFVVKFDSDGYYKDNSKHKLDEIKPYNDEKNETLADWGSDINAIHPEFQIPSYLQTESTSNGVSANLKSKLVSIPKSNSSILQTYRIPEKSIILDFINKFDNKTNILEKNKEYEYQKRLEENPEELNFVNGLNKLTKQLNLDALLKAVNLEEKDHKINGKIDKPKLEKHVEKEVNGSALSDNELNELLKIKKLMEAKGQEELLKCLQS